MRLSRRFPVARVVLRSAEVCAPPCISIYAWALLAMLLGACATSLRPTADSTSPRPTATAAAAAAAAVGVARSGVGSDGVRVTLAGPPTRIVSLSPAITEVLFAIGAGDRVVAVDRFSDFPTATASLPKLEYSSPSPESVLGFRPDLVIMVTRQKPQVPQFRALRLDVLYLDEPASLDATLRGIELLGALTGRDAEARALTTSMARRIEAVTAALAGATVAGPRTFYELSPDLYTAGPETFIGSMLVLLRARNIAQGTTSPFPQLSTEAVLAADPEVVLLSDAASAQQTAELVAARPGWGGVAAVRAHRVIPVDPDLTNRPGPRIVDGFELLARALYPDRFPAAAR